MESEFYFVEDAKGGNIVKQGTKKECEIWCDKNADKDRIYIIRTGVKK